MSASISQKIAMNWSRASSSAVIIRLGRNDQLARAGGSLVRFASSKSSQGSQGKPIVLEQPAKFNPPSHPSRLPKRHMPKHYGPALTKEETQAQTRKDYPGLMAPEGTWAHWFYNNRKIHMWISLSVLVFMAAATAVLNYTHHSPFKHLVPPFSDLWQHPIQFFSTWARVIQLHEADRNAKVIASRERKLDDLAKKRHYQAAHGLDKQNAIKNLLTTGEEESASKESEIQAEVPLNTTEPTENGSASSQPAQKKWFGIF